MVRFFQLEKKELTPMFSRKFNIVGACISRERKKAGLSQEALAEKLHVTRQTISNWESGVSHS